MIAPCAVSAFTTPSPIAPTPPEMTICCPLRASSRKSIFELSFSIAAANDLATLDKAIYVPTERIDQFEVERGDMLPITERRSQREADFTQGVRRLHQIEDKLIGALDECPRFSTKISDFVATLDAPVTTDEGADGQVLDEPDGVE